MDAFDWGADGEDAFQGCYIWFNALPPDTAGALDGPLGGPPRDGAETEAERDETRLKRARAAVNGASRTEREHRSEVERLVAELERERHASEAVASELEAAIQDGATAAELDAAVEAGARARSERDDALIRLAEANTSRTKLEADASAASKLSNAAADKAASLQKALQAELDEERALVLADRVERSALDRGSDALRAALEQAEERFELQASEHERALKAHADVAVHRDRLRSDLDREHAGAAQLRVYVEESRAHAEELRHDAARAGEARDAAHADAQRHAADADEERAKGDGL
jgi:hypothetical protein